MEMVSYCRVRISFWWCECIIAIMLSGSFSMSVTLSLCIDSTTLIVSTMPGFFWHRARNPNPFLRTMRNVCVSRDQ